MKMFKRNKMNVKIIQNNNWIYTQLNFVLPTQNQCRIQAITLFLNLFHFIQQIDFTVYTIHIHCKNC